jgi:hypothetical protein
MKNKRGEPELELTLIRDKINFSGKIFDCAFVDS